MSAQNQGMSMNLSCKSGFASDSKPPLAGFHMSLKFSRNGRLLS